MKPLAPRKPFLSRLMRDRSGNTLAIVAAATAPLVAMVGSAVDIGRGYVAQSRLQQACDAGTLAARKKLGSDLPPSNAVLGLVREKGKDFFDLNFPEGRYDTTDLEFVMTLEEDFSITGTASANLPTAIMGIFGKNTIPISVSCGSRMNFTNLDIMMVLDVTGSMRHTNAGDSASRIDTMRSVIKGFHGNIEASKAPDTRIRYGFVPYATNVNVGGLLKDEWIAQQWTYQSRESAGTTTNTSSGTSYINYAVVNDTKTDWYELSTYPATLVEGSTDQMECTTSAPENTYTETVTILGTRSEPFAGPPAGTQTFTDREVVENGAKYQVVLDGNICRIQQRDYDNHTYTNTQWTRPYEFSSQEWLYKPLSLDVSSWRSTMEPCIEERDTYEITDYDNVDLTRALDLDIDLVPTPGDVSTQWRPLNKIAVYAREITSTGAGALNPEEVTSTAYFQQTGWWWMSDCPAPAQKLAEMDASAIDTYLAGLEPEGATYHDIGMIWGARLLSPDGLFASDNADESKNKPTTRHMIFLTDGQTEPYDVAYGPYGVEPLDRRRWDPATSTRSLVETVEERFKFACKQIKKKNTTVWVIAFGTSVNAAMTECAGPGHYFEAENAAQLDDAFASIARSMGDLRVSK